MLVVADTGPLHCLVLIGQANMLATLYKRVLVPATVVEEMLGPATPDAVRGWISRPPAWLEVRPDPPPDATQSRVDRGESAAIGFISCRAYLDRRI